MKLLVLTCGVFPSEEEARNKMWIFFRSCAKFGIDAKMYGCGRRFPAYRPLVLDWQLEYLKTVPPEYTHCLFTDGWDAFFCAGLPEIIHNYEEAGSPPILCSAFFQLANVSDAETDYPNCFDPSIRYRYPNRGGYIAERPAIIEAFERMLRNPDLTGDDCFEWYRGWKEGWFRPQLDSSCSIFQVSHDDIAVVNGRLRNIVTERAPCILHLSGGYTDQVTGKDDRMIPWAEKAGIL